ncbi:MAG: single-stranded DNA-binding protein [Ignavibacteria bacterium GWA2_35_9]|nr:MAG: single-stranded DNA-binding protein [Ignavibacteria bacterium GWA2_35_9]OGU45521.1 MAG: single-stranded DNA-binding protein [Ignavibacteria bacterium GWB2_36_8]OGU50093.1 MAG: single-stranded DNA-binding protein [Ignavibacteria bacterium GWC2_36_12]OGV06954.1 MAG: single-stranded DNA-binding protein [Ignavibacteria bacterium RIFOXYB2_FULL_36_7]OGV23736.1 MAG: single-stranded DNA-binding protein [Ignavibacteria bacterium RIFOXYA2_FULL_37_17]
MADLKMPEINYVIVAGNLTKDPIFRQTTNSTPVVNFSIASNRKYKDSSNQWQEDVCYVGIVAWNKLAESCRDRLKKGSAVLVDGELQSRSWKSDDGHNRSIVEIKARRIQFLNKRERQPEGENGAAHEDFIAEEDSDYTEDSFDKFLSNEESDLIK